MYRSVCLLYYIENSIFFFDKKKWIPDIKKLFGYYQEIILISRIRLIDINKSNFWYQEFHFLIYKTSVIFLVIKNYFLYIKKNDFLILTEK